MELAAELRVDAKVVRRILRAYLRQQFMQLAAKGRSRIGKVTLALVDGVIRVELLSNGDRPIYRFKPNLNWIKLRNGNRQSQKSGEPGHEHPSRGRLARDAW